MGCQGERCHWVMLVMIHRMGCRQRLRHHERWFIWMLVHCVGVGGKGGILRLEKRELVRIGCEGGGHKVGRQAGGEG